MDVVLSVFLNEERHLKRPKVCRFSPLLLRQQTDCADCAVWREPQQQLWQQKQQQHAAGNS
jgi:hypothetical protein